MVARCMTKTETVVARCMTSTEKLCGVQVGGLELLKQSAVSLVERAKRHGSEAELEVYDHATHVFQVHVGRVPREESEKKQTMPITNMK